MNEKTKKGLIIGGSTIAALSIVGLVTTSLVLSSKQGKGLNGIHDITFFSNFPDYRANGFNKSTYNAALNYQEYIRETEGYQGEKSVGYSTTKEYDDTGYKYVDEISDVYDRGAEIILTSGFQVANTFTGQPEYNVDGNITGYEDNGIWGIPDVNGNVEETNKYKDKKIVLLDDDVLGSTYQNAASVRYAAEGAGFAAGIASSIYTEWNFATNDEIEDKLIVMWGGINYSTVYSFLSGFAQSITWFNDEFNGFLTGNEKIEIWNGGSTIDEPIDSDDLYSSKVEGNVDWYSGGFDGPGESVSAGVADIKTTNALKQDASILFPIAGGNTAIALNGIDKAPQKTKVIGVDTDNTLEYPNNADDILGSATKSLEKSGELALWVFDDYDNDGIINAEESEVDANDMLKEEIENFMTPTISSPDGWLVDDSLGYVFEGTITNGGVGFTYKHDEEVHNSDFEQALNWFFENAEFTNSVTGEQFTSFEEILELAIVGVGGIIEDSDPVFTLS